MREAVVVEAVRTPIGKRGGLLSTFRPDELLTIVLKAVLERAGIEAGMVEDVVVGCTTHTGEQGNNIARISVLAAGFPDKVPATTLNRKCGSSQQALHFAAQAILAGDMDVVIAAGIESMSRVPIGADRAESSERLAAQLGMVHQGEAAELVAEKWQLQRTDLDQYSLESHRRAHQATEAGFFLREIVPIPLADGSVMDRDEGIRPDTTLEKLAQLKPAFRQDGRITAGSSSQISDGAAAALLMSSDRAEALGLRPRARVLARTVVGSDPTLMLTGPIAATQQVLARAGLDLEQIDRFEVNEAFACVPLMWARELNVSLERVNVWGGAIALGHPTGCSGVRLATTLINQLETEQLRYGLQTMCIAGGMATATIFERC